MTIVHNTVKTIEADGYESTLNNNIPERRSSNLNQIDGDSRSPSNLKPSLFSIETIR